MFENIRYTSWPYAAVAPEPADTGGARAPPPHFSKWLGTGGAPWKNV